MKPSGPRPDPVRGRVLACQDGQITLSRQDQVLSFASSSGLPALTPGQLVALRVQQGAPDELPRVTGVEILHDPPAGLFPRPGSDWWRLQRDGARGYRHLVARAGILDGIRAFFRQRGFLDVETPLLVESPGVEVHLAAVEARVRPCPGAPLATRYLITSPEYQMKRLLAGGFERIFQIAKVFRDAERGRRHRVEFTMLEWYRAFADYDALMQDCEELTLTLAEALGVGRRLRTQGQDLDLTPPWRRMTFAQALRERAGVAHPERLSPEAQERAYVEAVEPTLGRGAPEFLIDWPVAMASLARRRPDDPGVAERVEWYAAGLELANGFTELTDASEQRARIEADLSARARAGLPAYPADAEYLAMLEEGLPPSAGIALGVDRLVMLLLDAADIADVTTFG